MQNRNQYSKSICNLPSSLSLLSLLIFTPVMIPWGFFYVCVGVYVCANDVVFDSWIWYLFLKSFLWHLGQAGSGIRPFKLINICNWLEKIRGVSFQPQTHQHMYCDLRAADLKQRNSFLMWDLCVCDCYFGQKLQRSAWCFDRRAFEVERHLGLWWEKYNFSPKTAICTFLYVKWSKAASA